jgi:phosphoribosylformylglycinamidine (FGAM) synthase-like enzyme
VTGGNVSLYNESPSGAVYPTPVIGMVGLIEDLSHITRATFHRDGDAILLLGKPGGELGGTEYLATIHGKVLGPPPGCDVDQERKVIDALLEAIRAEVVSSAHDCSDGGLAVALAECCIGNPEHENGAEIDLSNYSVLANREILFGESQARIVLSSSSPERGRDRREAGVARARMRRRSRCGCADDQAAEGLAPKPAAASPPRLSRNDSGNHGAYSRARDVRRARSSGGSLICAESSVSTVMRMRRRWRILACTRCSIAGRNHPV